METYIAQIIEKTKKIEDSQIGALKKISSGKTAMVTEKTKISDENIRLMSFCHGLASEMLKRRKRAERTSKISEIIIGSSFLFVENARCLFNFLP